VNLLQDGTGTRTVTWPASIVWINSTNQVAVPSVNTNAGYYSHYHFWQRSGTVFGEGPSSAPSLLLVNLDAGTGAVSGWGVQLTTTTGTLTASATNQLSLMASNATTFQADFTGGTPLVQSAHVMRVNSSIYLTNPIVGRMMTFHLRGDLNATDRTISVLTNGLTGDWPVHWGMGYPTNGSTSFTVTNNFGAELSVLVCSNAFSAFYSPQR
jgi:hypothetical protein